MVQANEILLCVDEVAVKLLCDCYIADEIEGGNLTNGLQRW